MRLSRLLIVTVLLGVCFATGFGCGGGGGGGNPDAKVFKDALVPQDAPAALTGLGKKCDQAMNGADCTAEAPLCTGFQGTTTYCSPLCVTAGTATGAANNQFTAITPAPNDTTCSSAFHGTVGMPRCVGILNNFMPADNPVVVNKAYTNINMTCAVLCGAGNTCPPGMTMNTSLGACACFPT